MLLISGVSSYPQDLTFISTDLSLGRIAFAWSEIECEKCNGFLLGYECVIYYDNFKVTENVFPQVTDFTIQLASEPDSRFPRAISVAAINDVGVGDHCPPVTLTDNG